MIEALRSLKSLIKTKQYHIDYPTFRLHYQGTVGALLAFCLILTAKILFGDTIDCYSKNMPRNEFWDNMCFSQGTYTEYIKQKPNDTIATHYLFSGIPIAKEGKFERSQYWHKYYQYMPIILFLQATFFYFPHYLWKSWENGVISSICKQLHEHRFAPAEFIESNPNVVEYLQNCFVQNKQLVVKYYICHLLLVGNLLIQVIILDSIFNNQFFSYGYDVLAYLFADNDHLMYGLHDYQGRPNPILNNPMDYVFPKVTGCDLETQSAAGGGTDSHRFLCALPLNILHDKFFFILWCWFVILACVTIVQILFDSMYTTTPAMREHLFRKKYGPYLSRDNIEQSSLSKLFLLDIIGSNSDKFAFSALLRKLNKEDEMIKSEFQSWV